MPRTTPGSVQTLPKPWPTASIEAATVASWSASGATNAGATYIWYGRASLSGLVAATSRDGFYAGVAANDNATQCGAAGDINNDGYIDLAIGVPGDDTGGPDSGASYIVFGGPGY